MSAATTTEGRDEAPGSDTAPADGDDEAVDDRGDDGQPVVTLLDPGAEPRQPLRFRLSPATVQHAELVTDMTADLTVTGEDAPEPVGPQILPTITMSLTAEVRSVDDRGSAKVTATYEDPVVGPGAFDPAQRQAIEDALARLDGASISITQSSRGEVIYADVDDLSTALGASGIDPVSQLSSLAIPFPVEAVGVGAMWTADQLVHSGPLRLQQRTTYTVTGLDGDVVTISAELDQHLAPGSEDQGPNGTIEQYRTTGHSETVVDLTGPLPVSHHSTLDQVLVLRAPAGSTGSVDQRLQTAIAMTRTP